MLSLLMVKSSEIEQNFRHQACCWALTKDQSRIRTLGIDSWIDSVKARVGLHA